MLKETSICVQQQTDGENEKEGRSTFPEDSVFNKNPVEKSTWMGRHKNSYYNNKVMNERDSKSYILKNFNDFSLNEEWSIVIKFTCSFNASYYFWKSAILQFEIVELIIKRKENVLLAKVLLNGTKDDLYKYRSTYFIRKALQNRETITTELSCFTPIEKVFRFFLATLDMLDNFCSCKISENIVVGSLVKPQNWYQLISCKVNQAAHDLFVIQLGQKVQETGSEIPVRLQLKRIPKQLVTNNVPYTLTSILCSSNPVDMAEHYFALSLCQNSGKFVKLDDNCPRIKDVSDSGYYHMYYLLYVKI